jgi:transcriptional regulator with XRE-family HTH domain
METRIKELRKSQKLSQTDFGKRLGVSRDVINNIENKRVIPSETILKLIVSEFSVSKQWLETGEGEMFAPLDEGGELAAIFGRALSPDCPPERRRVIKAIMALLEEIPDDMLPVIGKHIRTLADACDLPTEE